jgi:2-polyprenyl-3-methyl-5-hydroxy-6-metoxy-1,4-benzoquinol methylase
VNICRVCQKPTSGPTFEIREMMFGLREKHQYFQCETCKSLQLSEIPADMNKYYDSSYYSYTKIELQRSLKHWLATRRDNYLISKHDLFGKFLARISPSTQFQYLEPIIGTLNSSSRFLDVGCGTGGRLLSLRDAGFSHLSGADPYISENIDYGNGVSIRKSTIHELETKHDVVMFHHSFEHLLDPLETLKKVNDLLDSRGWCVIRIPIIDCHAWKEFGVDWVQLDAPRHFVLHSVASMRLLAENTGFEMYQIIHDSNAFQFWGSIQWQKDIPHLDERSYAVNPHKSIFSKAEIAKFEERARALNAEQQGDQAIFVLRKKTD